MQSPSLLLVFAQSGRFIAESATRAGYTVRVADCFGDHDTLQCADRWLALPALSELSKEQLLATLIDLSDNQPCWLVCGTGIEHFYSLLPELPAHIQFAGTPVDSLAVLRQPKPFFTLLHSLALPFPEVSETPPDTPFLLKNMAGSGGYSIQSTATQALGATEYYQHHIDGDSYSVCFVADGKEAQILGWNRQYHRLQDFTLIQIQQPAYPPVHCQHLIEDAVNKLTEACGLRGINSLDYLVDKQGQVFILEINPRISASVELLSHADVINCHLAACAGQLPEPEPHVQAPVKILHYLLAEQTVTIDAAPRWPVGCHDLPDASSHIEAGMPICTLIAEAESETACQQQLEKNRFIALQNCHADA